MSKTELTNIVLNWSSDCGYRLFTLVTRVWCSMHLSVKRHCFTLALQSVVFKANRILFISPLHFHRYLTDLVWTRRYFQNICLKTLSDLSGTSRYWWIQVGYPPCKEEKERLNSWLCVGLQTQIVPECGICSALIQLKWTQISSIFSYKAEFSNNLLSNVTVLEGKLLTSKHLF